jgi:hypothetical protein
MPIKVFIYPSYSTNVSATTATTRLKVYHRHLILKYGPFMSLNTNIRYTVLKLGNQLQFKYDLEQNTL